MPTHPVNVTVCGAFLEDGDAGCRADAVCADTTAAQSNAIPLRSVIVFMLPGSASNRPATRFLRQTELRRQMIKLRLKGGIPLRVELASGLQVVDGLFECMQPGDELGRIGTSLFVQRAITRFGNGTTTTHGRVF